MGAIAVADRVLADASAQVLYPLGVGFRDDDLATRARAHALEEELRDARAELAARDAAGRATTRPKTPGGAHGVVALFAGSMLSFGGALYAGFVVSGHDGETVGVGLGLLGAVIACLAAAMLVISQYVVVVPPNEIAILSGRQRPGPDGSMIGFRVIRGGRAVRIPLLERLDFMALTNMPLSIEVPSCYAKGPSVLTLRGSANVKIASEMPYVMHAVERFLGQDRARVAEVARQTLEGALRGVVAQLTIEEIRADLIRTATAVTHEVEHDMRRLGLVLDTFTIDTVEGARTA